MSFVFAALPYIAAIAALVFAGIVAAKLYTRSSQERAFVRTGLGGMRVVMSGGAMVLPIFHEIIWVNRNTLRLEVRRDEKGSLITKDRLRVDVGAEFYVRVAQDAAAIANAAQTLGQRTLNPAALKELVEGKFVDALRTAAAAMTMDNLQDNRAEFVQNVKNAVSADLEKNGLELEAVSLTGLNQTGKQYFDTSNAFDAQGLLVLTQAIEKRNKERNDIEVTTQTQIQQANLDAAKLQLDIKREGETARLNNERDIAAADASTKAEIAKTAAEGRRRSEEANLVADQQVATKRAETERETQTAQVNAKTAVQLRTQETDIEIANKSKDVAAADAEASVARALAVTAEERVETARQTEVAERKKKVTLVAAEEKAKEDATAVTIAAEADKDAAAHRAEAVKMVAQGERDASLLRAEGIKAEGEAEALALEKKNDAQNKLSDEQIALQRVLAIVNALPQVIAESVKPIANIDSIRIAEVGGLNGGNAGNGANGSVAGGSNGGGNLGEQMVGAALRYRGQQPVVDALLKEVGLGNGGDMSQLAASAASLAGIGLANTEAASVAVDTPAEGLDKA